MQVLILHDGPDWSLHLLDDKSHKDFEKWF